MNTSFFKSSKDSLVPCSRAELLNICRHLQIPLAKVLEKHIQIMDMISSGEFQKRYKGHKSTYLTLMRWLSMDVDRGYIEKNGEILQPEIRARFEKKERIGVQHGIL